MLQVYPVSLQCIYKGRVWSVFSYSSDYPERNAANGCYKTTQSELQDIPSQAAIAMGTAGSMMARALWRKKKRGPPRPQEICFLSKKDIRQHT